MNEETPAIPVCLAAPAGSDAPTYNVDAIAAAIMTLADEARRSPSSTAAGWNAARTLAVGEPGSGRPASSGSRSGGRWSGSSSGRKRKTRSGTDEDVDRDAGSADALNERMIGSRSVERRGLNRETAEVLVHGPATGAPGVNVLS